MEITDADTTDRIREAFERKREAVRLRPAVGRGTATTRATLRNALTVDIADGQWNLVVDMPEKYGSFNEGPNPGVYGRTALAACLAIGYQIWAAIEGISFDSLEVEVQADYDSAGELGIREDVPPGYTEIRYHVTVQSDEPEARLRKWLDLADRNSSWLDTIRRPVPVSRKVTIQTGGA